MLSPAELAEILKRIPAAQRDSARISIAEADRAGWFGISVWAWIDGRQHEADLVGFDRAGEFRFLFYEGTPKEL